MASHPRARPLTLCALLIAAFLCSWPVHAREFVFEKAIGATFTENFIEGSRWWIVSDFDNDGSDEVVVGPAPSVFAPTIEGWAHGRKNSDGSSDIAYVQYRSPADELLIGPSTSVPPYATTLLSYLDSTLQEPTFGDFDGDGFDDLAVLRSPRSGTGTQILVLLRKPGRTFGSAVTHTPAQPLYPYAHLAAADITGDGRSDLITSLASTITIYAGNADGSLTLLPTPTLPPGAGIAGDVNGDGAADMVILAQDQSTHPGWTVLLSQRNGQFVESARLASGNCLRIDDFDKDGRADILFSDRIEVGHGDGTFSAYPLRQTVPAGSVFCDTNGDSRRDAVIKGICAYSPGNTHESCVMYFVNRGWAPEIVTLNSIARAQGSAGAAAPLATISDLDEPPGGLKVDLLSAPAGFRVTDLVNTAGVVTGTLQVFCNAAVGTNSFVLQVSDSSGVKSSGAFTVNVLPPDAPQIGDYRDSVVKLGDATTVAPTIAPANATLTITASPPFPGTLTVDGSSGEVRIGKVSTSGTYTMTVLASGNCGTATSKSFQLMVVPAYASIPVLSTWLILLLATALAIGGILGMKGI